MKQKNKPRKYSSGKNRTGLRSTPGIWVAGIVGGILLLAAALFALGNSNSKGPEVSVTVDGQPALKVDRERVDLGDMKFGALANVSFTVSNQGGETLQFTEKPFIQVLEGC